VKRLSQIKITDITLRECMNAYGRQFSIDDACEIAGALDESGVAQIEITQVETSHTRKQTTEYLRAVCDTVKNAQVGALLLPGNSTSEEMKWVVDCGIQVIRFTTHSSAAHTCAPYMLAARKMGLSTVGLLTMAHMTPTDNLVEEACKLEAYGAHAVYIVDSAGAMMMGEVRDKVSAVRTVLGPECEVGFHGSNNLGLAVANALVAIEEGAVRIDTSLAGLGEGAGNTPIEVLTAACVKSDIDTGVNLYHVMDIAEDIVRPKMAKSMMMNRASLTIGYAGVQVDHLRQAVQAAGRFDVDPRDVAVELGKFKADDYEGLIHDIAHQISQRKLAKLKG